MLARRLHQLEASIAIDLGTFSLYLHGAALRNKDLLVKRILERDLSACLLGALAVGRRREFESIEVAHIWSKEV